MNFSIKLLKTRFVVTWQQAPGFDMLHNKYIKFRYKEDVPL